ncbi:CAP domain-containing protein [Ornithinibacillus sp. 179-J 7C1 HS]|uniref:CAP domain-containing protein n=1 Tax=Ornithinibacillus sp. 179-J 7C1 HS TaxID=3142384 RepID=UPI0039A2C492
MFKKIGIVTALSATLILGAAFDTANAESNTSYNYKVYYSINGENGNLSREDAQVKINDLFNKWMEKYLIDWEDSNEEPVQKEEPSQPEKPEQNQTQVSEPTKEQAPVQVPSKEQVTQEEPDNGQSNISELSQFEQDVVDLTNQEREKYGLSPLKIDLELSKVAKEKSRDMASNNYFSHNSPNYGSPFDMMKSFGITYHTAGENIAKGQRSPEEVVNAWMNSEGHRANILNANFTHIGVGYVEQGNLWTQQFIGK